eukprot:CAMPEP_0206400340 /NCGR_PEP_ID=MMETSP0294-20121207/25463_1 /ASSEMBLY_ACC=CAM_ASM_000327 /TAXON_ID=39354 /ORGANISM="Heterosigma akashiwo, Strain CCMP2393" /LENGTH=61 /DNA_ID=CAMNT_0053856525 /DNA_START=40 /DNA_END=222 /DNA_ORIENTATION=+
MDPSKEPQDLVQVLLHTPLRLQDWAQAGRRTVEVLLRHAVSLKTPKIQAWAAAGGAAAAAA